MYLCRIQTQNTMELPKPFRAQKITNGNANEAISNFMLKNSLPIKNTGKVEEGMEEYFNILKNKGFVDDSLTYQEFCEKYRYFQILKITESEIHFIPFKYLDCKCEYGIGELQNSIKYHIKNDMIKEGYTFTSLSNGKYIEALKEIYIRTTWVC